MSHLFLALFFFLSFLLSLVTVSGGVNDTERSFACMYVWYGMV